MIDESVQNLNETEKMSASAAKRWRLKLSTESEIKKGAFSHFRVIFHCNRKDAFQRIINAGGGVALDVKPPYHKSQTALQATHCFMDSKIKKMDDKDRNALKQAGVQLLRVEYLHAYLLHEDLDSTKYVI